MVHLALGWVSARARRAEVRTDALGDGPGLAWSPLLVRGRVGRSTGDLRVRSNGLSTPRVKSLAGVGAGRACLSRSDAPWRG
jgi:hypothetical protein